MEFTINTPSSTEYWLATALQSTNKTNYAYDNYGVKCIVKMNDPKFWEPCEPWCQDCGFPKGQCDEYFTRCRGYQCGRWFNEEKGEWIEAESLTTDQQEEEDSWNQHKYGLCHVCNIGLNDKSEFTFNYTNNGGNGIMMCLDCVEKLKQQQTQMRCTNCLNRVTDDDIEISTWDSLKMKVEVIFCSKC